MDKIIASKHQIAYDSLHFASALIELDKKTRYYGTDVPIFHSEIHVIMAIAEHSGIHVGGLADILGVTKGNDGRKKLQKISQSSCNDVNLILETKKKHRISHD